MYNNNGLNNEEVKENRKKYGSNNISGKNTNTFFNLFIETLGRSNYKNINNSFSSKNNIFI